MLQQKQHQGHTQEEENIDSLIKRVPLALELGDKIAEELGLFYLPYSTGFEIECCMQPDIPLSIFNDIPYLISNTSEADELKFRIPQGLKGLHCLSHISLYLRKYALLNPNSGIHYHIDCTDVWDDFTEEFIKGKSEWILSELDTWEYKGTYNKRCCIFSSNRHWTRFKDTTKTMEFRIGEMTFDYELLFKRIVHCNEIVRTLKTELLIPVLARYNKDEKEIIKNRIIKI